MTFRFVPSCRIRQSDVPGVQIEQAALALAIHGLREVQLPAEAIIDSEPRGSAPLILGIEEEALLSLLRIGVLRLRAPESSGIAQQKCRKTEPGE